MMFLVARVQDADALANAIDNVLLPTIARLAPNEPLLIPAGW